MTLFLAGLAVMALCIVVVVVLGARDATRAAGGTTERDKLKLWNMQTAPRPFWRVLAARIWRNANDT